MNRQGHVTEGLSQLRHGLRTPLNHIIGYAEMLLEDATEFRADRSAGLLREILCEAQRVRDLLQANASSDGDPRDVEYLRVSMAGPIRRVTELARDLNGLDESDIRRIRTAADALAEFVEAGKVPSGADRAPQSTGAPIDLGRGYGRLLVVDDDEANRDVLQRHLERQGYVVEQAASGREALARLATESFDGLLLDLVMPGMNGLEVLDTLRQDGRHFYLPVLVISASDDLSLVADSIKRGAEDYLFKPFDPVLLDARLSATLERKRLRDRERSKQTELELVTAALKRSNEDLQRFAYAASHDLQAPVRTITAYLQLLERRLGGRLSAQESEMIGFAQGAARRMNTLIHDLLLYSQASTEISKLEVVDCEALTRDLLEDLKSLIEEAGASVKWEALPQLVADATGLRQVLQNLISNAIKYRREQAPVVVISALERNSSWQFCVSDNGQGIEPQHTERIFEMFQRLHGEELPGSGIGLAICYRIIERLGGKIWVESEPGRGSDFYFTIPGDLCKQ
jgi:signal transduction histidine kinase